MILLDTNVVSEPLKLTGDVSVLTWIDAQIIETLYLSTISLAELRFGIAALAPGKRRDMLHTSLEQRILPLFVGRILPFDVRQPPKPMRCFAPVRESREELLDPQTATCHDLIVATRDTGPFEAAGLAVINPWNTQHERIGQTSPV